MASSGNYDIIDASQVIPGDVVMFTSPQNHTGIVTSYNALTKNGTFFGSQRHGPEEIYFGPGYANYKFPSPSLFLRAKKKITQVAPLSPPAKPPSPPLKWAYPVKLKSSATDYAPAEYFAGLSRSLGGTYPMGANGLWHPGVHFDLGGASHLDPNAGVFAIADGQIVAYRIDPEPLKIRYPTAGTLSEYSSSFVLIKHKLQIPPKPPAAAAASDQPAPANSTLNASAAPANATVSTQSNSPSTIAEQPSIDFYSLYMHLLDAKTYSDTSKNMPWPPYLVRKAKVKTGLSSSVIGLRIRDKPGGAVLGIIPKFTKVELGTVHSTNAGWKKIQSISGLAIPAWNGGEVYVHAKSLSTGKMVGDKCKDTEPELAATKVAYIYAQPKSASTAIIANLPEGAIVTLGPADKAQPHFHKILAIENMQGFPEPKDDRGKYLGWVDIDDLEILPCTPPSGVQKVDPPIEIAAGELIGHPGVYQHHNNSTKQIQVHVEIFTPDDLPGFMQKSREWAKDPNLPERDKTLLQVPAGTKLIAATPPAAPNSNDLGMPTCCELVLSLSALNALKPQFKTSLPESAAQGAKTWRYWYLDNVAGQAGGKPLSGWLCEKDTTKISPWAWPGFECVEDATSDEQLIAYQLKHTNKLRGEEIAKYSSIDGIESSSTLMSKMISIINTNRVEGVTVPPLIKSKVVDASKEFWCTQKIAKIAVKTKTEWKKDEARWSALDTLMGNRQDNENPDWVAEKKKIAGIGFWTELSLGGEKVWYLNAAGAVANFYNRRFSWAKTVFGETVAQVESRGSYNIYNRGATHKYEIVNDVNICEYSLAKMMEEGNKNNIFAAGKFQLIPDTLNAAVNKLKLDTSLPFDEEMQDFIFDEYLIKIKRPQIIAFLEGNGVLVNFFRTLSQAEINR